MNTGTCACCGKIYKRNRPLRGITCSPLCTATLYRRKPHEKRVCKGCGKEFTTSQSSKVKFCSVACFNKSPFRGTNNKLPMFRICERCGSLFKRHAGHLKQRFCSRQCVKIDEKLFSCVFCKKEWSEKTSRKRKYCSRSCARQHYGELLKNSNRANGIWPNYREAKTALLKANSQCSNCGWSEIPAILELHHIDRNRRNNRYSNLTLLCPTCHTTVHFKTGTGQFKNNVGLKSKRPKSTT